jgi:hypothetical protein
VFEANQLVKLNVTKELPGAVSVVSRPLAVVRGQADDGTPPTNNEQRTTNNEQITVFHRKVPAQLPPGQVLVIEPENSCDLWQVGDNLQNPIVTKQDKDSPLMAHVRLDNVMMPEARKLTLPENAQVLVAALTGDPLYCAFERPEGKVLVLTVNLEQGDLPLRTAFPIMATNALAWFTGNRGELRESLATGATTEVDLSQHAALGTQPSALSLWTPDKQPRPLPPNVSKTTIGPLDQCGVWSIGAQAPAGKEQATPVLEIACNLANKGESDIRSPEMLLTAAEAAPAASGFGVRPIWFYLLALAWVLVAVEWYLYQRRWIS